MKRLAFALLLFVLLVIAHHAIVYIHEWTHGFVAWLAGYKNSPFNIHYGVNWFTLWDIDEDVDYRKIYSDGKPCVVAWIAMAPTLLEMILFPIGLRVLNLSKIQENRWLFAFVYFLTLVLLSEVYDYIPIRTFSSLDDMFNFLTATGFSPWIIAIPGTLFVIWGLSQILTKQMARACTALKVTTESGRFTFKLATLVIFFGYFGAVGFTVPDRVSHTLSWLSWAVLFLSTIILCSQTVKKHNTDD